MSNGIRGFNVDRSGMAWECRTNADVAELVDALDLGSSAERRGGSSPFIRTSFIDQVGHNRRNREVC